MPEEKTQSALEARAEELAERERRRLASARPEPTGGVTQTPIDARRDLLADRAASPYRNADVLPSIETEAGPAE